MTETWQRIPGYDRYEASDQGRIRSLEQRITRRDGVHQRRQGRILKGTAARDYLKVAIGIELWQVTIHRLVLLAFRGPCPEGMEARHLNGNPHDNRLCNLEYGTKKENAQDKHLHGTMPKGESHWRTTLTAQQVNEIRQDPGKHRDIAIRFGTSKSTVTRIKAGKVWK